MTKAVLPDVGFFAHALEQGGVASEVEEAQNFHRKSWDNRREYLKKIFLCGVFTLEPDLRYADGERQNRSC